YYIWLTELDTQHAVSISSPTAAETIITTPVLRGLELHLPAGTVITDYDGNTVRQVSITQIPIGRPPFPLPNVPVPIYFTIQRAPKRHHQAATATTDSAANTCRQVTIPQTPMARPPSPLPNVPAPIYFTISRAEHTLKRPAAPCKARLWFILTMCTLRPRRGS